MHRQRALPTSEVYDCYWRLAVERQAVFFRRFRCESSPWTDDSVLGTYRFTNAYRASDRASQYLIRNVIYGFTDAELIRIAAESQEQEFERLGLSFETLWGRRLQLVDCQNLFSEIAKYARIRRFQRSGLETGIKGIRKFTASSQSLKLFYPPKWKLNDKPAFPG